MSLSYYWIDTLEGLHEAYSRKFSGSFPILAPEDPVRRERWAEVLAWYDIPERESLNGNRLEYFHTTGRNDSIICIGQEFDLPASFLASVTERRYSVLESIEVLDDWLAKNESSTVMIIAPCRVFKTDNLFKMSRIFQEHGSTPWGVLTAGDVAGLTFQVVKVLAATRRGGGMDGVIDVIQEQAYTSSNRYSLTREALLRMIDSDWRALSILAHGEGAHVNLKSVVLCGLPGDVEMGLDSRPVPGCSGGLICKRVNSKSIEIRRPFELRARVIGLVSCNGFSVAGEMYPSNVSFIRSAAEGYAAAVITTIRPVAMEPLVLRIFSELLRVGFTMGEIVVFKNKKRELSGDPHAYILHGDPTMNAAPRTYIDLNVTLGKSAALHVPRIATALRVRLNTNLTPAALEFQHGGEAKPELVVGSGEAVILSPEPNIGSGRLVDRGDRLNGCESWIRKCLNRLHTAVSIERALANRDRLTVMKNRELRTALKELGKKRLRIEAQLWDAVSLLESIQLSRVWNPELEKRRDRIQRHIRSWDHTCGRLLQRGLVQGHFYDAAHFYHRPQAPEEDGVCARCKSRLVRVRYESPDEVLPDRIAVKCHVCGPILEHRKGGVSFGVALKGLLEPGKQAMLEVNRKDAVFDDVVPTGFLFGEIRDKGKDATIHSILHEETSESARIIVPFLVPEDTRYDLHDAKFTWIQGLDVTYFACRFPLTR